MSEIPRILRDELPKDLQGRLANVVEPVVIRHHPDSKRETPRRWLLLPILATTTFGALCAALIPAAPFTQLSSIALFVGAGLFGATIAASRPRPLRPEQGQRLLVGAASLALVQRDHVEILPAESIKISDDGQIFFREELFDLGGHDPQWLESLQKAMQAAARNETDGWRESAKVGQTKASQTPTIAIGAGLGLVLALGIELAPITSTTSGSWIDLRQRLDHTSEWILAKEEALHIKFRAEFDERLPKVSTAMEAITLLLDVQGRGLGDEFEGPTKEKLHTLALAELAAAPDTATVEPLIRMALAEQIEASFLDKAKERYAELVSREMQSNPSFETFDTFLRQVRSLGLGEKVRVAIAAEVTRLGAEALSSARSHDAVAPYLRLCVTHKLTEDFCGPVRAQYATLAREQLLSRSPNNEEFTAIEELSAQAQLGDELDDALRMRRHVLALSSITRAKSGSELDDAASEWLNRVSSNYREILEPRVAERASALARSTTRSRDAALLIPLLPEEERDELFERYLDMAANEARDGGIDDARAFINAPDFSAHPERPNIEERLTRLCYEAYALADPTEDGSIDFFSALLSEMCIRGTSTLTYHVRQEMYGAYGDQVTNVADAAPELAKVANEMASMLGRPMEVKHQEAQYGALIELRVTGFNSLGGLSYPCTLHIKRLFASTSPETLQIEATCTRKLDF